MIRSMQEKKDQCVREAVSQEDKTAIQKGFESVMAYYGYNPRVKVTERGSTDAHKHASVLVIERLPSSMLRFLKEHVDGTKQVVPWELTRAMFAQMIDGIWFLHEVFACH